ncbi:hypothetical protein [Flavobacterium subsaxonicum]|uniref:hypothetical protein n=1 Tax=Flavobacterium subsaxonicum TaxID=426226 RepID=UPI000408063C|nr:hypothetical protein [Flavobacterium subsaxonicum]
MDKKYLSIFIKTAATAAILLIVNLLIYYIPSLQAQKVGFIYSIPVIYLFFFIFSVIILGILTKISEKNEGQVGYAFLLLTSVKMAASYFLAKPIIAKSIEFPTEKYNFFAVFVLFLAIEAYFTVRLLNNKQ